MIMTREDFRRAIGLTRTSLEGGHIKAVQKALQAYHDYKVKDTSNVAQQREKKERLNALHDACKAWRARHTQEEGLKGLDAVKMPVMKYLIEQVNDEMNAMLKIPRIYKTVQFIGYHVQTAGDLSKPTDGQNYVGLDNEKNDIKARCQILADAIDAARADASLDPHALKIFIAPEFFFRGGKGGAYSIEAASGINAEMDPYLKDSDYRDWIFVLGTAIAHMPLAKGAKDIEMLNLAIVRKGGVEVAKSNGKDSLIVYKEYVSAIDYLGRYFGNGDQFHRGKSDPAHVGLANVLGVERKLRPTDGARDTSLVKGLSTPNVHNQDRVWQPSLDLRYKASVEYFDGKISRDEMLRRKKSVSYKISEESKSGLGGGSLFEMSGYKFALEICLDHAQQRMAALKPKGIDFHLVTSCGMSPNNCVAKDGGYFFLVDGINSKKLSVHMQQRIGMNVKKIPTAVPNTATPIDMTKANYQKNFKGAGTNLFELGRGQVIIFKQRACPA
jgi:hypothetical protein